MGSGLIAYITSIFRCIKRELKVSSQEDTLIVYSMVDLMVLVDGRGPCYKINKLEKFKIPCRDFAGKTLDFLEIRNGARRKTIEIKLDSRMVFVTKTDDPFEQKPTSNLRKYFKLWKHESFLKRLKITILECKDRHLAYSRYVAAASMIQDSWRKYFLHKMRQVIKLQNWIRCWFYNRKGICSCCDKSIPLSILYLNPCNHRVCRNCVVSSVRLPWACPNSKCNGPLHPECLFLFRNSFLVNNKNSFADLKKGAQSLKFLSTGDRIAEWIRSCPHCYGATIMSSTCTCCNNHFSWKDATRLILGTSNSDLSLTSRKVKKTSGWRSRKQESLILFNNHYEKISVFSDKCGPLLVVNPGCCVSLRGRNYNGWVSVHTNLWRYSVDTRSLQGRTVLSIPFHWIQIHVRFLEFQRKVKARAKIKVEARNRKIALAAFTIRTWYRKLLAIRLPYRVILQRAARKYFLSLAFTCIICMEESTRAKQAQLHSRSCHICSSCFLQYLEHAKFRSSFVIKCPGNSCVHQLSDNVLKSHGFSLAEMHVKVKNEHQTHIEQMHRCPLTRKWAKNAARVCPLCKVVIFRFSGCDHMTCKCGHSFNWTDPAARFKLQS